MGTITRGRTAMFKVPNCLILDGSLSYSARRMGAVLYSRRNHFGTCQKSQAYLATLAGCSVTTARKALEELEAGQYIVRCKNYKYNEAQSRLVYDQYTYQCKLGFIGGFTLIPRDVFRRPLKSSSFVLCLYLYLRAGNSNRAFPSLNRMCKDLWMGKSTVCRAIKALAAIRRIYAQSCQKANRAFSSNSYFFLGNADYTAPVLVARHAPCTNCVITVALRVFLVSHPLLRRSRPPHKRAVPFSFSLLLLYP